MRSCRGGDEVGGGGGGEVLVDLFIKKLSLIESRALHMYILTEKLMFIDQGSMCNIS